MKALVCLLILITFISCKNEEAVYPFDQSPYVEFETLKFTDNINEPGILSLSFILWDIEEDIGIEYENTGFPFHQYNAVVDSNDQIVTINNDVIPPFYSIPMNVMVNDNEELEYQIYLENKNLLSTNDSRKEYSCDDYIIIDFNFSPKDSLMGSENHNRNSLQLDFINNGGELIDFQEIFNFQNCMVGNFDAQIPILDPLGFLNEKKFNVFSIIKRDRYSYRITYNIQSLSLKSALADKPWELQFQVLDRELNYSNIASSGLITLEEITN